MAQVNAEAGQVKPVAGRGLEVVLFGMPDAGKTSLLGALAQAATTQDKVLGGTLSDVRGGLGELRRAAYDDRPGRTPRELVPYPVTFLPDEAFAATAPVGAGPTDLVLFDCDGRVANEILSKPQSLLTGRESELAEAILGADTLLLCVDASARTEVLKRDFGQFIKFLHLFQRSRSRRTEVGGLPVYLVLTKCDLIADAGDTPSVWMDKIEDRKRKVDQFFRDQLAEADNHTPFGTIDLRVWATAIRRPELANAPTRSQEPYQVAELFRQVFQSALAFHRERRQAQRKLNRTFFGVLGLAAILVLLAAAFFFLREPPGVAILENKIRNFRTNYPAATPERFLRIPDNLAQLEAFQKDLPAFEQINPQLRQWVNQQHAELTAYRGYEEELSRQSIPPANILSEKKLQEQKTNLEALAPPPAYAAAWENAPAVVARRERLDDVRIIGKTADQLQSKLTDAIQKGKEVKQLIKEYNLTKAGLTNEQKQTLFGKVVFAQKEVEQMTKSLPDREEDKKVLEGILIPGSERIYWRTVLDFPEVQALLDEWKKIKKDVSERVEF